jgi:hypothetical protein
LPSDAINLMFYIQTLVIEASTDSGGIGLDDVRFKQVSCSGNYFLFILCKKQKDVLKIYLFRKLFLCHYSSSLKS